MSAIGLGSGKNFVISGYADYRHDKRVFARMQSNQLRDLEWEGRLEPLQPWSTLLVRFAAVALLAGMVLALIL